MIAASGVSPSIVGPSSPAVSAGESSVVVSTFSDVGTTSVTVGLSVVIDSGVVLSVVGSSGASILKELTIRAWLNYPKHSSCTSNQVTDF